MKGREKDIQVHAACIGLPENTRVIVIHRKYQKVAQTVEFSPRPGSIMRLLPC